MSLLKPDRYFSSITSIDIEWDLLRLHLDHVLLDVDNTILRRDNHEVPIDVRKWLVRARQKGLVLCLFSNNFHASVHELAQELDLPIVAKALKPLPFGYQRAMRLISGSTEDTVMVGDQLFTDVVGAHLVGMPAYLVCPLVEEDLKHTLVMRKFERLLLRDGKPDGVALPQGERAFDVETTQD